MDLSAAGPESSETASLAAALDRIGDRWTLLTGPGTARRTPTFGELEAAVPGIATNVLTTRLRALERLGVVVATPYSTRPPRFEYHLTDSGHALADATDARCLGAVLATGRRRSRPCGVLDPPRGCLLLPDL